MNKSAKLLKELRNKLIVEKEGITLQASGRELLDWITRVDNLLSQKRAAPSKQKVRAKSITRASAPKNNT